MWTKLAHIIIKYRLALMLSIAVITIYMASQLPRLELSYEFAKIVPADDPEMRYYQRFKDQFGVDDNVLVIGVKDSAVYHLQNFKRFRFLSDYLRNIPGVNRVISLPNLEIMHKDSANKTFYSRPVFETIPDNQAQLDSLLQIALDQRMFTDLLFNGENGAMMMVVNLNQEIVRTARRQTVVDDIIMMTGIYSEATGIDLHLGGLPYLRDFTARKVNEELHLFLKLSALVTALILLAFFRSWKAVIFPMIVIGVMVIWTLGTLVLLGYKITMLTGLLPAIIVIIGIPNCIYLLNKYHHEYQKHGIKMLALSRVIRKIGVATLITNFTTAVGFGVLAFTDIGILKEFGVVASLNIMGTFLVSIILIPAVFSYLPSPSARQLSHLKLPGLDQILTWLDLLVHRQKYTTVMVSIAVVVLALVGVTKLDSVSFVSDDIPAGSKVAGDLKFFEQNFGGVMPLELIVDTGKNRGVNRLAVLRKVEEFEQYLKNQHHFPAVFSMTNMIKGARQAFYNHNPSFYQLPDTRDQNFIRTYLRNYKGEVDIFNALTDSISSAMRVSIRIPDIGSRKLSHLVEGQLQPKLREIFEDDRIATRFTGSTLVFIMGNEFLINNLLQSLLLAFAIIGVIMAILFANLRMILISLVPNLIPLIITAGAMGFAGIPLKPSTALIFSVVFGISVDDSIHYLAKYRQELFGNDFFVPIAVSNSIREIGPSMIYTSIVLFAGFIIFAGSDFGGTVALGILAGTTLVVAMFTNLIVLPSLLLIFDGGRRRKDRHPLIEQFDEWYDEEGDEETNWDLIELEKASQSIPSHQPMTGN